MIYSLKYYIVRAMFIDEHPCRYKRMGRFYHPDARLIAAAPEMLEVITTVMRGPKNWNGCSTRPRSW